MALNLNKYADRAAYTAGASSRPANQNCTSLAGQEVIYDGVNIILKKKQLGPHDVCNVVWDNTDAEYVYIPSHTYIRSQLDSTRYTDQNFIRFTRSLGKEVLMHKEATSRYWAEFNRYKLTCTTSAAGGFNWAVTINGTAKSGTLSWSAGATLDSIVTQMNGQGAVSTYLVFTHNSGENFIRIVKGGYTYSVFTITNATGATLTDLSIYTKVGGVQQSETHRDWQTQNVDALFPSSGFLPANSAQYAKNGYNLSWMCGGNLARYKAYYTSSGSATYVAESTVAARMTPTAFAALNGSGVAEQQALYDKYSGSWDAYMDASMVKINDTHTNGIEYQSYANGDTQTAFLASVTTMDFDGSYIPAYPCAYNCRQKTSTRNDLVFNMPTEHELAVLMEDSTFAKINKAMTNINGTSLSNSTYYWSSARSNSYAAWYFDGDIGLLGNNYLYHGLSCRPLAYL